MSTPTLWHIPMSHYSEKARWALEHKSISYRKMAPPPGAHMAIAAAMTRGRGVTFPILRIDGSTYGDSSTIIAGLESRFPEQPLYPADAAECEHALELEEYFDENIGPAIRRYNWHYLSQDPDLLAGALAEDLPEPLRDNKTARSGMAGFASRFVRARYKAGDPEGAAQAKQTILDSLDRLEAELGDGEYLVGDTFSVADLTAASLFYPLVSPPEGPRQVKRPTPVEEFRAAQVERPGFKWVEKIFAEHRRT
ncbi:hypothetical protein BH10ACT11_BH10ACT11_07720 [soil metagenome]